MTEQLSTQAPNRTLGRLFSLLVIPAGVALWVLLWNWGFMASIVAFAIAYGAIWLYQAGAKTKPARKDVAFLISVIVVGVVASFLGGMVSDGWYAWTEEFSETTGFFSGEFLSFIGANFTSGELWGAYVVDILIAVVFAALGAGVLIRDLLKPEEQEKTPQQTS